MNIHDSLDNDCQGLARDKISKSLDSVIDAVSSQQKLQPPPQVQRDQGS